MGTIAKTDVGRFLSKNESPRFISIISRVVKAVRACGKAFRKAKVRFVENEPTIRLLKSLSCAQAIKGCRASSDLISIEIKASGNFRYKSSKVAHGEV
jgi:hypothetical protein